MRATTTGYWLHVKAETMSWDETRVRSLKPMRITKFKPSKLAEGVVAVYVEMTLPDMLFAPVVKVGVSEVS